MERNNNNWSEWKNHVLIEQQEIKSELSEFRKEFNAFRLEQVANASEFHGSSKAWSVVAGFISSVVVYLIGHFLGPAIFKK